MNWQLTAAQPMTVSIYANPLPITQTLVMTGGAPITVVVQSFSGTRIFTQTNEVINGSAQSRQIDLSALPGGIYHLWLDADDGVNPPVRLYAPETVNVPQPWPSSWQAQLQTQPGFQQIGLRWQSHPSPDVQGYILSVSPHPFTATRTITVGATTEGMLNGLESNVNYRIGVEAVVFDADGAVIRQFPILHKDDATSALVCEDLRHPRDQRDDRRSRMILLLTTNHTLVQGMAALLETIAESAELVTVQNATEAHSLIAAGTVALVIVDGALGAAEIEPFLVRQATGFPPILVLAENTDQLTLARHKGVVFVLKGSPAEDLLSLLINLLSNNP